MLDKYDEIVKRRTNITTSTETLKKNTEGILNKTKDILEFSGKQEDIDEIHDEMIDKLIEYEKEKCNKKVEELEKKKRNPK